MKLRGGSSATARLAWLSSLCFATAAAFSNPCFVQRRLPSISTTTTSRPHFRGDDSASFTRLGSSSSSNDSASTIWQPKLRKVMAGVASAGALETGYLTFQKYTGHLEALCGVDGNCQDVLQGPYSTLPFTDIPLSILGCLAYVAVAVLAMQPFLEVQDDDITNSIDDDDSFNRVALTTVTTTMATFSVGLMILLFGVLQTSCPYCIFSATCSILLAKLAWIGGCLPKTSRGNGPVAGFLTATFGAALLFVSGGADINENSSLTTATTSLGSSLLPPSSVLLASSKSSKQQQQKEQQLYRPPDIETESSTQALQLADELERLDAKMYGAYWCSHCFDQKETLGKQAFSKIPYVECSKEGIQSQSKLCKEQRIPGYPTWQIQGQLYPGEQSLEELQELVQTIQREGSSSSTSSSS